MKVLLPQNSLVFDIGACIGLAALNVLFCKPRKIVCIEPQERCFSTLENLQKRFPCIEILQQAVSDQEGHIDLYLSSTDVTVTTCQPKFMENRRLPNAKWEAPTQVPCTTIDALIAKYGLPDYCKIDVEGHEESVLRGLSQPIALISFEYHAQFREEAEKCFARLSELGEYTFNFALLQASRVYLDEYVTKEKLFEAMDQHGPDLAADIFCAHVRERL